MRKIRNQREWDFVLKETHRGFENNPLQREMLFILQI